jgi:spermidine synthase
MSRSVRTNALFPDLEPVDYAESRYQNLELLRLGEQYTLFANGHQLFTFPNEYGPRDTADLVLTQHPNPKTVLLVGSRSPELVRAMLRHDVEDIEAVGLDPRVLELARPYFSEEMAAVYDDARLALMEDDGRRLLITAPVEYDTIFLNLPDPLTALVGRYYTKELYAAAKDRLAENGLLVFTFTGTPLLAGRESFDYGTILYRTASEVFEHVLAVQNDAEVFVFCSREPDVFSDDPKVLEERYRSRNLEPEEGAYRFHDLLWPDKVEKVNTVLRSGSGNLVSTDWHPRAYFHASLLWDRFVKARTVGFFRWMLKVPFWAWLALVGVIFLARLGLRFALRRPEAAMRSDLVWSVATTGLTALALEIMFIFAFQNLYGYVYEKLGLVVALFMLGLAVGANWGTERFSGRTPKGGRVGLHRIMAYMDTAVAVSAFLFVFFVWLCSHLFSGSEALFYLYLVWIGALTGMQFPLATRCRLEIRGDVAGAAGALDAADHLGAAFGALLTGVLLVPLYGLAAPVILLAILKLCTAGFQYLDSRSTG